MPRGLLLLIAFAAVTCSCGRADSPAPKAQPIACRAEWFRGPPDIKPAHMTQQTVDWSTGELGAEEPVPPGLVNMHAEASLVQSRGLIGARVTVHRAYPYDDLEVIKSEYQHSHYPIGVDVEIETTAHDDRSFDPDDVELVDGGTGVGHGYAPQVEPLTQTGELTTWDEWARRPQSETNGARLLLVFPAPRAVTQVCLGYWGQRMTPTATLVHGEGPVIPR